MERQKIGENNKIPIDGDIIKASNYYDDNNWLSLPKNITKNVDVFYVYPTVWKKENQYPIANINSELMRERASKVLKLQGNIFDNVANIFAPFYRQLDAEFVLSKTFEEQKIYTNGVPKTDVIAAFDYYIKNLNNGRPFILLGHSQGAVMIKEILFDYLKDNSVITRMIASYVLGFSVTESELKDNQHIKFATKDDDFGIVISYNTEAEGFTGSNPTLLEGSIAINPITWTRGEEVVGVDKNLGSLVLINNSYVKVDNFADAKLNNKRGVVVCSSVDKNEYGMKNNNIFPLESYHSHDIPFYYYNLRKNIELRIDNYFNKNKK